MATPPPDGQVAPPWRRTDLPCYSAVRSTSEQWTQSLRQSAYRNRELIERAIHDGMLLNRKDDVHKTLRSIAKSPGVAAIRIYDKSGTIIFSADEAEIGRRVNEAVLDKVSRVQSSPYDEGGWQSSRRSSWPGPCCRDTWRSLCSSVYRSYA
jgi:hypothetical protein